MKKRNIVCGIIVGIVIIVGAFFIYPLIQSMQTEKQFNLAKEQIEKGNKDEGILAFVSLKDKKNNEIIEYFRTYITDLCNRKDFSEAESVINTLILNEVLESNKVLSDSELNELKQKVDDAEKEDTYEQAEQLVHNKKYTDAYFKYLQISNYKDSTEKATELIGNNKEDFYELAMSYVKRKDWQKAKTMFEKLGDYKDSSFYIMSAEKIIQSEEREKNKPKEPYIGMTAEQVENSTWGKPSEINKTTTKYGVHEQWVYPHYKYIYLDDGVVTAIQE